MELMSNIQREKLAEQFKAYGISSTVILWSDAVFPSRMPTFHRARTNTSLPAEGSEARN